MSSYPRTVSRKCLLYWEASEDVDGRQAGLKSRDREFCGGSWVRGLLLPNWEATGLAWHSLSTFLNQVPRYRYASQIPLPLPLHNMIIHCGLKKCKIRDFPGGPVPKTPCSQCRGSRFDPWSGNYIPHVATKTQHSQINVLFFFFKVNKKSTIDSLGTPLIVMLWILV